MNGHPRDQISSDIADGRPTLSPVADDLVARVERVSTGREIDEMYRALEDHVGRSPALSAWGQAPTRHLSEFDSATSTAIEAYLKDLLVRRTVEARNRGWEVDDGPTAPRDIR